jgi:hypothetical protein
MYHFPKRTWNMTSARTETMLVLGSTNFHDSVQLLGHNYPNTPLSDFIEQKSSQIVIVIGPNISCFYCRCDPCSYKPINNFAD